MTERPRLTISILCLNRLEVTRRCIDSILRNTSGSFELLITDNGSNDGTAAYLAALSAERPNQVFVKRNERNEGFIRPHNLQVKAARGDFIAVLNNDIELGPGWDALPI